MIRALLTPVALLLAALFLASCGFTPMHGGANGPAIEQLGFSVDRGKDTLAQKSGYFIDQRLQDRTGTQSGRYSLDITPSYRRGRLGITEEDIASRYDVTLTARYVLTDTKTDKVIDRGSVEAFTTFGAPADPYGVIVADDNATRVAAKEVADRLIERSAVAIAKAQ